MARLEKDTLTDRLYDAAIGQDDWEGTLTAWTRFLGADCLVLGYGQAGMRERPNIFSIGWDYSFQHAAGFSEEDIWDPAVNPDLAAGQNMPIARSVDRRELVSEESFASSDFLQTTVVKNDCLNYRLFAPYRSRDILSGGFVAKKGAKEFTPEEVRAIDSILPHLGRALSLRVELGRQRAVSHTLGQVLENLGKAIFLLDANVHLLFANSAGEKILRDGIGVRCEFNRIRFPASLEQSIKGFIAGGRKNASLRDMLVKFDKTGPSYRARIYPATGFAQVPGAVASAVVVVLEEQGAPPRLPDSDTLSCLFALTPAETAVARLVPSGRTKGKIGETLGVSENTVKTHIKNIRAKTGARSVVHLAQILAQL